MPVVDVIDQTYVAVGPSALREVLCDEGAWARVLGDVELRCFEDRGLRGKRWRVSGALDGTAEIWLEEVAEGTVVHTFLQAEPTSRRRGAPGSRTARRHDRVRRDALKRWVTSVRDRLDDGRGVGEPPTRAAESLDPQPRSRGQGGRRAR